MIYLDYCATTPASSKVLDYYIECNKRYFANANSLYKIGVECKKKIDEASQKILNILGLNDDYEVIYTSGASESNNLALKGIKDIEQIITSPFEHSSVVAPLSCKQKEKCIVNVLDISKDGIVDLVEMEKIISNNKKTLITINSVNSEVGIKQPIKEIVSIRKKYSNVVLHVDATQSIGKEKIDLNGVDLISFSGHKFYGLKGIGCLIRKKSVSLNPLINGGKSTTVYRSGTPALPLILSLSKALLLVYTNFDSKYKKVKELNYYIKDLLNSVNKEVVINSGNSCLPHVLNISVLGYDSKKIVQYFNKHNIYISNHSACSSDAVESLAIKRLTNDSDRASSSIRISLSYLTKKEELREFVRILKEMILK